MSKLGEVVFVHNKVFNDVVDKKNKHKTDVIWVLICLTNQTGIDLNEAFIKNMEKKTLRDKERHKNNQKLK